MVLQILLALLADAVFESVSGKERAITSDVTRYFEQRGFRKTRVTRPSPAH